MTSLFGNHPGKKWELCHHNIPSHQHPENELRQINWLLGRRNSYILGVERSVLSVSNTSGWLASGSGLDRINSSVGIRNRPKTRPAACLQSKHDPVPVNLLVEEGLAGHVGSNLLFRI